MTEEEVTQKEEEEFVDTLVAEGCEELERCMKERRKKLLQQALEWMKEAGVPPDRMLSDEWWEHIPDFDFDKRRNWLTGLYMSPPEESEVVVCKDHPSVEPWMREEGVFGVVVRVEPPSTITACDENGQPIKGKDGKELHIPGIPDVQVAFSEDDYGGGYYLPADCLKQR